jgi:hypothetical protein
MQRPEATLAFAGVDGRTASDLPAWFANQVAVEPDEVVSFSEAIRQLPRAVETRVAYENPYTEEWVSTDRFTALVEPSRTITQASDETEPEADPLFHVPSSKYAVINPTDVYGPLAEVLRETTVDGTPLGDVLFGEVRQYRGGGEVHMDLLFDGLAVDLPGRRDPITMGVTSGYDFFGGHAVYVEGFARDTRCANSIRALTDRQTVKHVGDVGDFEGWWTDLLEQLELVGDDLYGFISDAEEIELDFREVPFDAVEFYELLGFPTYLAEQAAADVRASAADPFAVDLWTLHSGATYALTHHFRGREGSALDEYVRTANDILFNPDGTLERAERAYERQVESEGQTDLAEQAARASLERVSEAVREKAETFEAREAELRERFAAADGE